MEKEIKYKTGDIDEVFDEKGNMVLAIREIAWGDSDTLRLDMRKWYVDINKETPGKGFSFLTEDGPNNLVTCLTKHGYGDTEEILRSIKDRDDFDSSLSKVLGNSKPINTNVEEDESFYDPKESLF